jgi:hypothetical protein
VYHLYPSKCIDNGYKVSRDLNIILEFTLVGAVIFDVGVQSGYVRTDELAQLTLQL